MNENNYIVYRHTSPSGKVYIGITKQSVKLRWRSGRGYKHCTIFLLAINKYNWENIQHEILLENQPELSAKYAEIYLIKWYKMHNISYNVTDGGEGGVGKKMSIESRQKCLKKQKNDIRKLVTLGKESIIQKKQNYYYLPKQEKDINRDIFLI